MAEKFHALVFTDSVMKAQKKYYGASQTVRSEEERDTLTEDETLFIQSRDSFYMATISETGWPYIQHRGGKAGFLRVTGPNTLAFADYKGNRQMLSTGNLSVNDRVCLFLMDYPMQTRLKLIGHARVEDARQHAELVKQITAPDVQRLVERIFFIDIVGFDWNCPKHITPRFTVKEIEDAVLPLKQRIAELEAQLKAKN